MPLHYVIRILGFVFLLAFAVDAIYMWHSAYIVGAYYNSASPFLVFVGAAFPMVVAFIVGFASWLTWKDIFTKGSSLK